MDLTLDGRLYRVGELVQVTEKFKKRLFVIDNSYEVNGNRYDNYPQFQLLNANEDLIVGVPMNTLIRVHFAIQSSLDQNGKYWTNLNAFRIEPLEFPHPVYPPPTQSALPQTFNPNQPSWGNARGW